MIEELGRYCRAGNDRTVVFVVGHRHAFALRGGAGGRQHRGSARVTLLNVEPVRNINNQTFEVVAMGEQLVHDVQRSDFAPVVGTATRDDGSENIAGEA